MILAPVISLLASTLFLLSSFTNFNVITNDNAMGASGWSYFVPYESNVKTALAKLQAKVFEAGDYYDPCERKPADDQTFTEWIVANNIKIPKEKVALLKKAFESGKKNAKEKRKIKVTTIEELREKNGDTGTHSILDIREIEETDVPYKSGKVSDKHLLEIFTTLKPTREMILANEGDLQT